LSEAEADRRKVTEIAEDRQNSREVGYYFALAQTGLEIVAPIGIGLALDHYLGWSPWGVIGGTILGFVGGLVHLIVMVNRHDAETSKSRKRG
jgi:F0F1-type ATP synthase assembly protein I